MLELVDGIPSIGGRPVGEMTVDEVAESLWEPGCAEVILVGTVDASEDAALAAQCAVARALEEHGLDGIWLLERKSRPAA